MFKCNVEALTLEFFNYYLISEGQIPPDAPFCLVALKDGRVTGGQWWPSVDKEKLGSFVRGPGDGFDAKEVHACAPIERWNLSKPLEDEGIERIVMGDEADYSFKISDLQRLSTDIHPKAGQYCLLIMNNGTLALGRWECWNKQGIGSFSYAPATWNIQMEDVWAWAPLSVDEKEAAIQKSLAEIEQESQCEPSKVEIPYAVQESLTPEEAAKDIEEEKNQEILRTAKTVSMYSVLYTPRQLMGGWNLEKYVFFMLDSGDLKVTVQAGDRAAGSSRDFLIPKALLSEDTYESFLDKYLEIVPECFGLNKEDLLKDAGLKDYIWQH